ncbi:MAG: hypothetical protein WA326_06450 [Nitrososphaeraceae archaeon]
MQKSAKLFFIYVTKEQEWRQRQDEDWDYVYSLSRFYHWWIKRYFEMDFIVEADILPVVPGKLFDRMSIGYLQRDHKERGKSTYHFYLTYSKPLWTDCTTEAYSSENFGMVQWKRPQETSTLLEGERIKFLADANCANISHVLTHEVLRMKGRKRTEYFDSVHEVMDKHIYNELPYIYFNDRFNIVSKDSHYRFVTLENTAIAR